MLHFLGSMFDSRAVNVLHMFGIVANETTLFSSFDIELDMACTNRSRNLHVDNSRNRVAWLIERVLRL